MGKSRTWPATERKGDPAESIAGAVAPPCITAYCPRQRFGEDATRAALVHTEELTGSKRNPHRDTFPRQLCNRAPVRLCTRDERLPPAGQKETAWQARGSTWITPAFGRRQISSTPALLEIRVPRFMHPHLHLQPALHQNPARTPFLPKLKPCCGLQITFATQGLNLAECPRLTS